MTEPSPELAAEIRAVWSDPSRRFAERYVLLSELGQGAAGRVHRAWDAQEKRLVALKTLVALDDHSRARFERELQALHGLEHPGIAAVRDAGEHEGTPFLALDFVDGRPLDVLAKADGGLPAERAAEVVRDVARALAYAHEQGVLHRDVKPQNIVVEEATGRARLVDFGLAGLRSAEQLTQTGTSIGTPGYMSPEQAKGDREATDRRTDVYSLGATLYRLLAGRAPFEADSMLSLSYKIVHEPPELPSELRPGVDPRLEAISLHCLRKAPAARYPTAGYLADDLDRYLAGESVRAPLARGRRWLWIGLGVALLSVAAGVVAVSQRQPRGTAPLAAARATPSPAPTAPPALGIAPEERVASATDALRAGDFDLAETELRAALEAASRTSSALVLLGFVQHARGEEASAVESWGLAHEAGPNEFERWVRELPAGARLAACQGVGISGLRVRAAGPRLDWVAPAVRDELSARAARPALAKVLLAAYTGATWVELMPLLAAAEEEAPGALEVALERVRLLVGRDRYAEVPDAVARAAELGAPLAELARLEAECLLRQGRRADALARYAVAAERDPAGADGLCAAAERRWLEGDAEAAADLARRALAAGPTHVPSRVALALALLSQQLPQEALSEATAALALGGALNARVLIVRALAFARSLLATEGDAGLPDAVTELGRVGAVTKGATTRLLAAGLAFRSVETQAQAGPLLEAAIRYEPERARAHLELGLFRLRTGAVESAVRACWDHAQALDPELAIPAAYEAELERRR